MELVPILAGVPAGVALWYFLLRPKQLREEERRRRELGLPPRKRD